MKNHEHVLQVLSFVDMGVLGSVEWSLDALRFHLGGMRFAPCWVPGGPDGGWVKRMAKFHFLTKKGELFPGSDYISGYASLGRDIGM